VTAPADAASSTKQHAGSPDTHQFPSPASTDLGENLIHMSRIAFDRNQRRVVACWAQSAALSCSIGEGAAAILSEQGE